MDDLLIVKQMESTSQCKDESCCENRGMFELAASVGYTFWFNPQAVKRPLDWGRRKERLRMCEMVTDCGYPTLWHHALGAQTKTDTTLLLSSLLWTVLELQKTLLQCTATGQSLWRCANRRWAQGLGGFPHQMAPRMAPNHQRPECPLRHQSLPLSRLSPLFLSIHPVWLIMMLGSRNWNIPLMGCSPIFEKTHCSNPSGPLIWVWEVSPNSKDDLDQKLG